MNIEAALEAARAALLSAAAVVAGTPEPVTESPHVAVSEHPAVTICAVPDDGSPVTCRVTHAGSE